MLGELDRADGIFRCSICFDLLGPVLGDGSAADHDLDARPQAFLVQLLDHFTLADHGGGEQGAHADDLGIDLQCLADDLLGGLVHTEVHDFETGGG